MYVKLPERTARPSTEETAFPSMLTASSGILPASFAANS
jgi:hypothetical protein